MSDEITVTTILGQWLRANGYDGLVGQDGECGCHIDDLILCDGQCDTCRPGHKGPDPSGDCDFLIYPTRKGADDARAAVRAVADDDALAQLTTDNERLKLALGACLGALDQWRKAVPVGLASDADWKRAIKADARAREAAAPSARERN